MGAVQLTETVDAPEVDQLTVGDAPVVTVAPLVPLMAMLLVGLATPVPVRPKLV
jgi:hypothetical protein